MKKILFLLLIVCPFNNCKTKGDINNPTKIRLINTRDFKLEYPNSWMKTKPYDRIILTPKRLRAINSEDEFNNVSVIKNPIYAKNYEGIDKTLDLHCNTIIRGESSKNYKIFKLKDGSEFLCKVEYDVKYEFSEVNYKRVEYFYVINNKLDYLRVQMSEELYSQYKNDIQLIVDSFEIK